MRVLGLQPAHDRHRRIGRTTIGNDHFEARWIVVLLGETPNHPFDGRSLIAHRHHDRDERFRHDYSPS